MRQQMRLWIELPKRLQKDPDSVAEAGFYARKYKRASSAKEREKVIESLLVNGSLWDAITRSVYYLPLFEKSVGKKFPQLWGCGAS